MLPSRSPCEELTKRVQSELDSLTGVTAEEKVRRIETIAAFLKTHKGPIRQAVVHAMRDRVKPPESERNAVHRVLSPLQVATNNGNTLEIYYHDVNHTKWYSIFYDVEFTEISQQITMAGAEGSSEPLYEIFEFIASARETHEIKTQHVENEQLPN